MSQVTNSLYSFSKDTSNDRSSEPEPAPVPEILRVGESREEVEDEDERPDTHKSNTLTNPDSDRSSTDKPTSRDILKTSAASEAINLFECRLKLNESEPIIDRDLIQDLRLLASIFSLAIKSPTLVINKFRRSIACNTSSAIKEHEDDPAYSSSHSQRAKQSTSNMPQLDTLTPYLDTNTHLP
jgi:hypothetical protein